MIDRERLRIVLCEPAGRGGIAHYTRALAEALAELGHDVLLLTSRDYEFGGENSPFAVREVFDRLRTPPLKVWRVIREFRPHVVHLQTATHPTLHLALLLGIRTASPCPLVLTAHNVVPKNSGRYRAWASGWLYRCAHRVIVHADCLVGEIRDRFALPASKIKTIPHGDYEYLKQTNEQENGEERSDGPLLFFGYLHPEKGLEDLLEAMPDVVSRHPRARLIVAGTPEMDMGPLQRRARFLGLDEAIEWRLGYVDKVEMNTLFQRASAVVLPYRKASQSGVIFLAGAFAKPVVATRIGGMPEVIADGRTGLLVPPEEPSALSEALSDLLCDPHRRKEMGSAHRDRCRLTFGWNGIARKTEATYRGAMVGDRTMEVAQ